MFSFVLKLETYLASADQLESPYPIFFYKPGVSTAYVLMQLSLHLNYQSWQVNLSKENVGDVDSH